MTSFNPHPVTVRSQLIFYSYLLYSQIPPLMNRRCLYDETMSHGRLKLPPLLKRQCLDGSFIFR